jgi:hypothetical protein
MRQTWTIGYRTGGTLNFKWHRTTAYETLREAQKSAEAIRRAGYPCYIYDTRILNACGLPETFAAEDSLKEWSYTE